MQNLRVLARQYENDTKGGLCAEDLIQDTLRAVFKTYCNRVDDIRDMQGTTETRLQRHYIDYVRGDNAQDRYATCSSVSKFEKHMMTSPIPEYWQDAPPLYLSETAPQEREAVQADVKWAMSQLSFEDQRLAKMYWYHEYTTQQIADQFKHPHKMYTWRKLQTIQKRLQGLLAAYSPSQAERNESETPHKRLSR